jgi:hypothetical protein
MGTPAPAGPPENSPPRPTTGSWQRVVAPAVAVLALVGIAREAWFHFVSEPAWTLPAKVRAPRPEERYRAVRAALPPAGRVGYLSDLPVATRPAERPEYDYGTWLYQQAQYALAPIVLVYGESRTETVLANVLDPAGIDALARAHGLRVVARFHGGAVAVLRR